MRPHEIDACRAARSIADHQRSTNSAEVLKAVEKYAEPLYFFQARNSLSPEVAAVPPTFNFSLPSRSTESKAT
jgi:hypothetical protein